MRIGETRWLGELFPLVSFSVLSLCLLLFLASLLQVSCSYVWHSHTLISGIFYQASLLMPLDGCHAHIWLQKPTSLWNKSPDLTTHTNCLGTAKWLPPLCRWKDKDTFSWMPNAEAGLGFWRNPLYCESERMNLTTSSSWLAVKPLVKLLIAPRLTPKYDKVFFPLSKDCWNLSNMVSGI